jgi:hypothetical protein
MYISSAERPLGAGKQCVENHGTISAVSPPALIGQSRLRGHQHHLSGLQTAPIGATCYLLNRPEIHDHGSRENSANFTCGKM